MLKLGLWHLISFLLNWIDIIWYKYELNLKLARFILENSDKFDIEKIEGLKSDIERISRDIDDTISDATELCTKLKNGEYTHRIK